MLSIGNGRSRSTMRGMQHSAKAVRSNASPVKANRLMTERSIGGTSKKGAGISKLEEADMTLQDIGDPFMSFSPGNKLTKDSVDLEVN